MIDKVEQEQFFRNGLPCDMAAFNALSPGSIFTHNVVNNLCVINSSFKKHEMLRKHFGNGSPLRQESNCCVHSFYYLGHTSRVFMILTFRRFSSNPLLKKYGKSMRIFCFVPRQHDLEVSLMFKYGCSVIGNWPKETLSR